jgi:predicted site-specific integrase-resolvase
MDMSTLCEHICCSPNTVDKWVLSGILPPARRRGGKLMWKWDEVDAYLSNGRDGKSPDADAERIRDATRRAAENSTGH